MSEPDLQRAADPVELDPLEHMLLWSFRATAIGRGECPMVRAAFQEACGALADQALTALFVLVRQFGWRGRRRLRLHLPGCCAISGDEMAILAMLGAAQAAQAAQATGDGGRLSRWLERLTDAPADPSMEASAKLVGHLLALNGRRLPDRGLPEAKPAAAEILELRPASAALH